VVRSISAASILPRVKALSHVVAIGAILEFPAAVRYRPRSEGELSESMPRKKKHDPLEQAIEIAFRPGRFIPYRDRHEFFSDLEEVAGKVEKLASSGEAERAVRLYETMIAGCHEKAEEIDDSGGYLGDLVQDLFCAWIRARQIAGRDAAETVAALLSWMDNDSYGFCHGIEEDAFKAMNRKGREAFVTVAQERFEAAAAERPDGGLPPWQQSRWGSVLKTMFSIRRNAAAYLEVAEALGLKPDDCLEMAKIHRKRKKLEEALEWTERAIALEKEQDGRYWAGSETSELRLALLKELGRADQALDEAWSAFEERPSHWLYERLMKYVPRKARKAWHDKAMQASESADLRSVAELYLETGEIERLATRIRDADDAALDSLHYSRAEAAAKKLARRCPDLAARLYRSLGMHILERKRSKLYHEAHGYFDQAKRCYEKAGMAEAWDALVDEVREEHHRKYSFMPGFEAVVDGSARKKKPTFLERARKRWPKDG